MDFIGILSILIKWRKKIITNIVVMSVIAVVISLLLPKWYESKAIVLPPSSEGFNFGMGGLSEIAGAFMAPTGYELPMLATRSDVFKTILESRRLLVAVITDNGLKELYKAKNMEVAIKKLKKHCKVEVGPDGSIYISFEAKKDPEFAAQVASSFVRHLDSINTETNQSKAKDTRVFIENRLEQAKVDLAAAEEAMKVFQEENNTIMIEEQAKATIEGSAQLVGELMAAKIQLGILSRTLNPTHDNIREVQTRIKEIDRMLLEIKTGERNSPSTLDIDSGVTQEIYLPLDHVPELGLEMGRRLRDFKIQEFIFEFLMQQYEQAKIREQEDTPTIQVLQYGQAPEWKSRPKRAIIVLATAFFALFVSVFFAFLQEYVDSLRVTDREKYSRLTSIARELRQDFQFLKRK